MERAPRLPGFEVLGRLGKGGMGEVFQAVRLGPGGFRKPVAVKRLPAESAVDGPAVQRFLQEARITARLEHPNIVRVHDLLSAEGYFLVMELLRGWSWSLAVRLRGRQGPVPWPAALEMAEQALAGLAYAHSLAGEDGSPAGLVHRDLSPSNLFLSEDGVVKILDFGIAKLRYALTPGLTQAGHLHGTLGFLAPEQARAEGSDPRSDLYQLAGVIYWTLSGRPPNGEGTAVEVLARAAHGRPPPLATLRPDLPPDVLALVARAMEVEPAARFADAAQMRAAIGRLLASAPVEGRLPQLAAALPRPDPPEPLEPLAEPSRPLTADLSATFVRSPAPATPPPRTSRRGVLLAAGAACAGAAAGYLSGQWARVPERPPLPRPAGPRLRFDRLSYRRGKVLRARFLPDGRGHVYSALWGDQPADVFVGSESSPETRSLSLRGAELVGLGPAGELALLIDANPFGGYLRRGTLARADLAGAAPRELLEDVQWADWGAGGELAVLRWSGQRTLLEWPMGQVRWESEVACLETPRFSPDGQRLVVVVHPVRLDTRSYLATLDRAGRLERLTGEWNSALGPAWRGEEVWFAGSQDGVSRDLYAVRAGAEPRLVLATPASLAVEDFGPGGEALLTREYAGLSISAWLGNEPRERDLSWYDLSYVADLSPDGRRLLFGDSGDALGSSYGVYLRATDGSGAVRLDTGIACALSPDGRFAAAIANDYRALRLLPTGPGSIRSFSFAPETVSAATWFPDNRRLLVGAQAEGAPARVLVLDGESGERRPLPDGLHLARGGHGVSPDGRRAALDDARGESPRLVDLASGHSAPLPGALPGERVLRFSSGGRGAYVARVGETPLLIHHLELPSGKRTRWRELDPSDPAGVMGIVRAVITADGKNMAFNYLRSLSTLFRVTGLS